MIYENVSAIFEHLNSSRERLLSSIAAVDSKVLDFRIDENSWTISDILEHLSKTEASLVPVVFRLLKNAESAGIESDGKFSRPISFERFGDTLKTKKFIAPEMITPTKMQSVNESLAQLAESRATILGLRTRIEKVDSSSTSFPHPFIGQMNLYEWLAFIGLHELRHLGQIVTVISAHEVAAN